jgi:hypothetical protein
LKTTINLVNILQLFIYRIISATTHNAISMYWLCSCKPALYILSIMELVNIPFGWFFCYADEFVLWWSHSWRVCWGIDWIGTRPRTKQYLLSCADGGSKREVDDLWWFLDFKRNTVISETAIEKSHSNLVFI